MGMSKGSLKRMEKMMKQLAESSVPEGETLNFCDVGAPQSAEEIAKSTKKGLAKTYAVGIATAGIGAVTGASGAAMRGSTKRYAAEQFQSDQYVAVVTDKHIRIINSEQKSSGFSIKYKRMKGTEDIVLPLDGLQLRTGEPSRGSMFGMKWTSLPITFCYQGDEEGFTLNFYKEEEWAKLAENPGSPEPE